MRFVQFSHNGVSKVGVETAQNGNILDLSEVDGLKFPTLLDLLTTHGENARNQVERHIKSHQKYLSRDEVHILPPISKPDKVLCIGLNYKDHCEEQGVPPPKEPIIFNKFPSTIIGPYDDIEHPKETKCLDWEVELAVVIGKIGKDITASSAMEYVFGYTVAHDVSARDWQTERNGGQWLMAKSMDNFCPLGPAIVTVDELGDPHNLAIECRVNGSVKQRSRTSELLHKTQALIAYISRYTTLLPGDVILTGTPPGVGWFMKPPEYLKKGDIVECEIEKIGTLINKVV